MSLSEQEPQRAVAAVSFALIASLGASLDGWGDVASIVAAVAAVLLLVTGLIGWLWRRSRLREPVRITYFIRQANYNRGAPLSGAPPTEQYPCELSVGPNGIYEVMHRLQATQAEGEQR